MEAEHRAHRPQDRQGSTDGKAFFFVGQCLTSSADMMCWRGSRMDKVLVPTAMGRRCNGTRIWTRVGGEQAVCSTSRRDETEEFAESGASSEKGGGRRVISEISGRAPLCSAHRCAVGACLLLLCLLSHAGRGDGATLTADQLETIQRTHCVNGTLSHTAVCNTTFRSYPAGCPSAVEQRQCASPERGSVCSEVPGVNMTCLTPFQCTSLELPDNAALAVRNPMALTTVDIVCDEGYEYYDQNRVSRGFRGEVDCQETGNFSDIRPSMFSCEPIYCGLFCRYCSDLETIQPNPSNEDWGWKDRFGACCLERSDPSNDFVNRPKIDNRLGQMNVKLSAGSLYNFRYGERVHVECTDTDKSVLGQVPASGIASPRCIPRPGCTYNDGEWSPSECANVRGMYEPAMTCNVPARQPFVVQYETPEGITTGCNAGASECEFPISVRIRLGSNEPTTADSIPSIFWTYSPGSPATTPSGSVESTPANGGAVYGSEIGIESVVVGCNVVNQYKTITMVVVVPGKPNSIHIITPELKITATRGVMPANLSVCTDEQGRRKTEEIVHHYCLPPATSSNKIACGAATWVPKPPLDVSKCPAYRYYVFEPIALAGAEADAYALSELRFFYLNIELTPEKVSTYGKHPAAEASLYVSDGSLDTKVLQMDTCSLEFDFGRQMPVDEYSLGTANDCNSRDPLRWKIFASNDRKMWVEVLDQSKISFSMPNLRTTATPRIPITSLTPEGKNTTFDGMVVTQSTNVPDALNTLTMSFSVKFEEACPAGTQSSQTCYEKDDVRGALILASPPLGTVLHIGGLPGVRTPKTDRFAVHSITACSPDGEDCAPLILYGSSIWHHDGLESRVQATILRCLAAPRTTLSFQTMNPPERNFGQSVLEIRGEGSSVIPAQEVVVAVLKSEGMPQIVRATVRDATREVGRNTSVDVHLVFNFAPMAGTAVHLEGLNGTRTPSTSILPIHVLYEDGSSVQTSAHWEKQGPGTLKVTLGHDARHILKKDGTMTAGHNITLRFSLVNSDDAQSPRSVTVRAKVCSRPASVGGCLTPRIATKESVASTMESAASTGGYSDLGPFVAEGVILISGQPCEGVFDACKQCDGADTICLGCDLMPNSGKVVDTCGVCGGSNRCIGCDGKKDSGKVVDACGICGGDNDCEIETTLQNISWPHIVATLEITNAPTTGSIKASDVLRFNLRSALAGVFLLPTISVDLMNYTDSIRRSMSHRALLFFSASPSPQLSTPSTTAAAVTAAAASAAPPGSRSVPIGKDSQKQRRSGMEAQSLHHSLSGLHTRLRNSLGNTVASLSVSSRGWRSSAASALSGVLHSLQTAAGLRVRHRATGEERREGVCDARKACWSGCQVNSALTDQTPLSKQELHECVLSPHELEFEPPLTNEAAPPSHVYKGPKRRQTRAPVPAKEIEYGTILLDIRLNYRLVAEVLYLQANFNGLVTNGTLGGALGQFKFCRPETPCLVRVVSANFINIDSKQQMAVKTTSGNTELRIILIVLGSVFGVLLCLALVLGYRWHQQIALRKNMAVYKMEDLLQATERGKKDNLRRANPSSFKPPEGFETNTVASASRAGGSSFKGSFKGTSVASGSFRQKILDDTGSVVSGALWPGKEVARSSLSAMGGGGSARGRSKIRIDKMDREFIYRQAFPEKFEDVPEETLFEADVRSRTSADDSRDTVSNSSRGASRVGSIAKSMASTRSSASDKFGDRQMPGPRGRGPSVVHGSGQARMLHNHPVAELQEREENASVIDEDDYRSDDGSIVASERGSVISAMGYMGRRVNGAARVVNGSKSALRRPAEPEDDVEHEIAV